MKKVLAGAALFALGSCVVFAQSGGARPEFEVASIKPAAPMTDGPRMIRMGADPGRVNYSNVSLRNLITRAYGIKDYQLTGPDWMGSQRFDVAATHPPNTPRETVNLMMQALLADRFKLAIHKEQKVMPAYALTEAKGGFKLKPVAEEGSGPRSDGKQNGMVRMMGRGHLEASGFSIQGLCDMLLNQVGRPVVDTTGIKGLYDFTLNFTPDDTVAGRGMLKEAVPAGAGAGAGGEHRPLTTEGGAEAPSIFAALQEKLGLKLDARREPVDIIVVDRVEKVPTEN